MSVQFHVREFRFPEDFNAVVKLWESIEKGVHLGRSDSRAEIQKKISRDPDLFLVADMNGMPVGTVIGGFDGRRGIIYHLAVAGACRKQGIGSRLMQEVESRLRAKGCLKSYLLVAVDNLEVGPYYENRGWQLMDQVKLYGKELQ
jgi:ribosomal protein S18 acetylase RimI-like enzyme